MSENSYSFQIRRTFKEHYSKCSNLLLESGYEITPAISLELYSAMYVVCDFAEFCCKQNANIIPETLLPQILSTLSTTYPQFSNSTFRKRILFYSNVTGDIKLHAHAFAGKDVSSANPVVKCAIAFSDCFLCPAYIEDYFAPSSTLDALECFNFSINVLLPLSDEFNLLFRETYYLIKMHKQTPINQNNTPKTSLPTSSTLKPNQEETVYYMESANGMIVRVPESKLESWQAKQACVRKNSKTQELTEQQKQIVKRIVDNVYGSEAVANTAECDSVSNHMSDTHEQNNANNSATGNKFNWMIIGEIFAWISVVLIILSFLMQ